MVKKWSKMVKIGPKLEKKIRVFSDKDFWIGRDPPPLFTVSKKQFFYASPYTSRCREGADTVADKSSFLYDPSHRLLLCRSLIVIHQAGQFGSKNAF